MTLTHNESIIIFGDIPCHLEIEDECLEVDKSSKDVFMVESSHIRACGS